MNNIFIRKGEKADLPEVLKLIKELAIYELAPQEVENTVDRMLDDGFGQKAVFGFFVAINEQKIVGTAIYYYSYSTWKGKCIFLEDLIVTESFRRKGIGEKLFRAVKALAIMEDAQRLSWQVLDWNEPAIQFYKKIGAEFDNGWINCRLTYNQLQGF